MHPFTYAVLVTSAFIALCAWASMRGQVFQAELEGLSFTSALTFSGLADIINLPIVLSIGEPILSITLHEHYNYPSAHVTAWEPVIYTPTCLQLSEARSIPHFALYGTLFLLVNGTGVRGSICLDLTGDPASYPRYESFCHGLGCRRGNQLLECVDDFRPFLVDNCARCRETEPRVTLSGEFSAIKVNPNPFNINRTIELTETYDVRFSTINYIEYIIVNQERKYFDAILTPNAMFSLTGADLVLFMANTNTTGSLTAIECCASCEFPLRNLDKCQLLPLAVPVTRYFDQEFLAIDVVVTSNPGPITYMKITFDKHVALMEVNGIAIAQVTKMQKVWYVTRMDVIEIGTTLTLLVKKSTPGLITVVVQRAMGNSTCVIPPPVKMFHLFKDSQCTIQVPSPYMKNLTLATNFPNNLIFVNNITLTATTQWTGDCSGDCLMGATTVFISIAFQPPLTELVNGEFLVEYMINETTLLAIANNGTVAPLVTFAPHACKLLPLNDLFTIGMVEISRYKGGPFLPMGDLAQWLAFPVLYFSDIVEPNISVNEVIQLYTDLACTNEIVPGTVYSNRINLNIEPPPLVLHYSTPSSGWPTLLSYNKGLYAIAVEQAQFYTVDGLIRPRQLTCKGADSVLKYSSTASTSVFTWSPDGTKLLTIETNNGIPGPLNGYTYINGDFCHVFTKLGASGNFNFFGVFWVDNDNFYGLVVIPNLFSSLPMFTSYMYIYKCKFSAQTYTLVVQELTCFNCLDSNDLSVINMAYVYFNEHLYVTHLPNMITEVNLIQNSNYGDWKDDWAVLENSYITWMGAVWSYGVGIMLVTDLNNLYFIAYYKNSLLVPLLTQSTPAEYHVAWNSDTTHFAVAVGFKLYIYNGFGIQLVKTYTMNCSGTAILWVDPLITVGCHTIADEPILVTYHPFDVAPLVVNISADLERATQSINASNRSILGVGPLLIANVLVALEGNITQFSATAKYLDPNNCTRLNYTTDATLPKLYTRFRSNVTSVTTVATTVATTVTAVTTHLYLTPGCTGALNGTSALPSTHKVTVPDANGNFFIFDIASTITVTGTSVHIGSVETNNRYKSGTYGSLETLFGFYELDFQITASDSCTIFTPPSFTGIPFYMITPILPTLYTKRSSISRRTIDDFTIHPHTRHVSFVLVNQTRALANERGGLFEVDMTPYIDPLDQGNILMTFTLNRKICSQDFTSVASNVIATKQVSARPVFTYTMYVAETISVSGTIQRTAKPPSPLPLICPWLPFTLPKLRTKKVLGGGNLMTFEVPLAEYRIRGPSDTVWGGSLLTSSETYLVGSVLKALNLNQEGFSETSFTIQSRRGCPVLGGRQNTLTPMFYEQWQGIMDLPTRLYKYSGVVQADGLDIQGPWQFLSANGRFRSVTGTSGLFVGPLNGTVSIYGEESSIVVRPWYRWEKGRPLHVISL